MRSTQTTACGRQAGRQAGLGCSASPRLTGLLSCYLDRCFPDHGGVAQRNPPFAFGLLLRVCLVVPGFSIRQDPSEVSLHYSQYWNVQNKAVFICSSNITDSVVILFDFVLNMRQKSSLKNTNRPAFVGRFQHCNISPFTGYL